MSEKPESNDGVAVGEIFTPLDWAQWVIEKYGILAKWKAGAVIFDPAAGTGNFLEALIRSANEAGAAITGDMISRLYGVETQGAYVARFISRVRTKYDISFPKDNFVRGDFLFPGSKVRADILLGNPPWANFTDLPESYKRKVKPLFIRYGLVGDKRSLLLGNARVDLAALIISRAIHDNLSNGGEAYFFMPLSILLNDGAHRAFRSYDVRGVRFEIAEVYDFQNEDIFGGVSTRYCLAAFRRDRKQRFPLRYFTLTREREWVPNLAEPLTDSNDPLIVYNEGGGRPKVPKTAVDRFSQPRQGLNTCGANDVFIFSESEDAGAGIVSLGNKERKNVFLPKKLVYPLIGKEQLRSDSEIPNKYVFLPYNPVSGRPLTEDELIRYPEAREYLESVRLRLSNRRGVLINSWIARGLWWALLGVGAYSFAPYKIVWEAYGSRRFDPKLFGASKHGIWQANQSLHAFMPFLSRKVAADIVEQLKNPMIERILLLHKMEGACNWAQPGRIKKFLDMVDMSGAE